MYPLEGVRLDADQQVFAGCILKKNLSQYFKIGLLAGVLETEARATLATRLPRGYRTASHEVAETFRLSQSF